MKHHLRDTLFLALLGALLFFPLLGSVHLFDWDEANFAEAAREMMVTGEYLRVQIEYKPFWEKPPLFFWLQALSMHLWGVNEFGARFVNAVCGIVTLLVVYGIGRRLHDRLLGLFWALAFAGSILPHVFFKSGIIDPVFNLFIFLGLYPITAMTGRRTQRRGRAAALAGLFIGLAVLTKGPVAFLIAMLCVGVYWLWHRDRSLFSVREAVLFVGMVAAVNFLFYGIETITHGFWFIRAFLDYHIRLLSTGDSGHGRPFYYHFLVLLFGCFPASVPAIAAMRPEAARLRRWLARRVRPTGATARRETTAPGRTATPSDRTLEDFRRWMMVLFWVVLLLFSLVKTKTVLYSSLTYFPLTFLAAWYLRRVVAGTERWSKWCTVALGVIGTLVAVPLIALPIVMVNREWLIALLDDPFTEANLARPVAWSAWLALVGVGYLAVLPVAGALARFRGAKAGALTLLVAGALGIQAVMIAFFERVEAHSQGGAVALYKELAGRDIYAKSLYKSYADEFYSRRMPPDNPEALELDWLLQGDIDKPAFFVQRIHRAGGDAERYGLTWVKQDGGFVLLKREPVRPPR